MWAHFQCNKGGVIPCCLCTGNKVKVLAFFPFCCCLEWCLETVSSMITSCFWPSSYQSMSGHKVVGWCEEETNRCLLDLWWSWWWKAISLLLYWLWPAILHHGVCCIYVGLRPLCRCSGYGPGFATLHKERAGILLSLSLSLSLSLTHTLPTLSNHVVCPARVTIYYATSHLQEFQSYSTSPVVIINLTSKQLGDHGDKARWPGHS